MPGLAEGIGQLFDAASTDDDATGFLPDKWQWFHFHSATFQGAPGVVVFGESPG